MKDARTKNHQDDLCSFIREVRDTDSGLATGTSVVQSGSCSQQGKGRYEQMRHNQSGDSNSLLVTQDE